jgi:hypothetical protein
VVVVAEARADHVPGGRPGRPGRCSPRTRSSARRRPASPRPPAGPPPGCPSPGGPGPRHRRARRPRSCSSIGHAPRCGRRGSRPEPPTRTRTARRRSTPRRRTGSTACHHPVARPPTHATVFRTRIGSRVGYGVGKSREGGAMDYSNDRYLRSGRRLEAQIWVGPSRGQLFWLRHLPTLFGVPSRGSGGWPGCGESRP